MKLAQIALLLLPVFAHANTAQDFINDSCGLQLRRNQASYDLHQVSPQDHDYQETQAFLTGIPVLESTVTEVFEANHEALAKHIKTFQDIAIFKQSISSDNPFVVTDYIKRRLIPPRGHQHYLDYTTKGRISYHLGSLEKVRRKLRERIEKELGNKLPREMSSNASLRVNPNTPLGIELTIHLQFHGYEAHTIFDLTITDNKLTPSFDLKRNFQEAQKRRNSSTVFTLYAANSMARDEFALLNLDPVCLNKMEQ